MNLIPFIVLYVVYILSLGMKRKSAAAAPSASSEYGRCLSLRHIKFVTQSALERIVNSIISDGILHNHSQRTQYRARKALAHTVTPYGKLVKEISVTDEIRFGVSPPLAAMYHHAKTSHSYSQIIQDTMRRAPPTASSPWNLVLYQDGVDPGDGLAKCHTRKSAVF